MSGKKRATGSNLKKVDARRNTAADYAEIPELGAEWFAKAKPHVGGKPRGRPKAEKPKTLVSLRLDPDVISHFRKRGPGWQSRINATLRKAAKLPAAKRTAKG